ncbi:hypothetical protein ACFWVF_13050 [Streptomyces sp. NPDC058659]|uniref:hypothetical protein n=1 Tax=unclassified Streptomyces TaxID=2593676 RepID=UPI003647521D
MAGPWLVRRHFQLRFVGSPPKSLAQELRDARTCVTEHVPERELLRERTSWT